jgi:hypothetical protein
MVSCFWDFMCWMNIQNNNKIMLIIIFKTLKCMQCLVNIQFQWYFICFYTYSNQSTYTLKDFTIKHVCMCKIQCWASTIHTIDVQHKTIVYCPNHWLIITRTLLVVYFEYLTFLKCWNSENLNLKLPNLSF